MDRIISLIIGLITIIVTMLLILMLDREGRSVIEQLCIDETERELVRENALRGIDDGFRGQMGNLFELWVKDPHEQPRRAKVGTQNAINAYVRARRDALAWTPPGC